MSRRYNDFEDVMDQVDILLAQDFTVEIFSDVHLRINDRVNIWPTRRKWYDQKTHQKGRYSGLIEFIHNHLGYEPRTAQV